MTIQLVLDQLANAELVRQSESDTYAFKHTLTQETAYRSLLKSERRGLHQAVAEAMEELYPDHTDLYAVLGFHWEQAAVPDRARHYLFCAGQDAARRFANAEALDLFTRALALGPVGEEAAEIYLARAGVYEFESQYPRALEDYEAALTLVRHVPPVKDECQILARMAWLHWLAGNGQQALGIAQQAEKLASELKDRSLGLRAHLVSGLVAQAEGNIADAYPRLRKSLFASRQLDARALEGESIFYLGVQNNFMGRFGRACACAGQAYEIKASLGDRVGEIVSLFLLARAEAGRGHYDAALSALEGAHAVAKETQNPFGLAQYPNTRAWLAAELGDWKTAYEIDRAGLEVASQSPVRPPEISTLLNLVLDCIALARHKEAEEYLLHAGEHVGRTGFGFHSWRWQMRLLDARARLLMEFSLFDEAFQVVNGLLDWSDRTESAKYKARAILLRARIYLAEKNTAAACADLLVARDLADVMCHLPTRLLARRALEQLYEAAGERALADQVRSEGRSLIVHTETRLEDPDLRHSFANGLKNTFASLVSPRAG
jgi:tetratricopeptide (TPR) repeat protein